MDQLTGAADTGELLAVERYLDARARSTTPVGCYGIALVNITRLADINTVYGAPVGDAVLI